jgi:hypothetical protein
LDAVDELTSRIRSDEIPSRLERLEQPYSSEPSATGDTAFDVCLASNIIEVGVDVPRLGLMCIVGQPKTTSQYIQVSSRVGRRQDCPGLVVTLYGQSKPRDRSHYERFRPYHQRIYAQVEPTSVTPFSAPAVDRILHAIIVGAVRQTGGLGGAAAKPDPFPLRQGNPLHAAVEKMIMDRVGKVSPEQCGYVADAFRRRLKEWEVWQPSAYGGFGRPPADPPLIYPAGLTPPDEWRNRGWPTLTSMRDVDATCEAAVTDFFNSLPA